MSIVFIPHHTGVLILTPCYLLIDKYMAVALLQNCLSNITPDRMTDVIVNNMSTSNLPGTKCIEQPS